MSRRSKGSKTCPSTMGATNWPSPAYSPDTGYFYVIAQEGCGINFRVSDRPGAGGGYIRSPEPGRRVAVLPARARRDDREEDLGIRTCQARSGTAPACCRQEAGWCSLESIEGLLTANDARAGKPLWHFNTGALITSERFLTESVASNSSRSCREPTCLHLGFRIDWNRKHIMETTIVRLLGADVGCAWRVADGSTRRRRALRQAQARDLRIRFEGQPAANRRGPGNLQQDSARSATDSTAGLVKWGPRSDSKGGAARRETRRKFSTSIKNGIPATGMPPSPDLTNDEIWKVTAYLQALRGTAIDAPAPGNVALGRSDLLGQGGVRKVPHGAGQRRHPRPRAQRDRGSAQDRIDRRRADQPAVPGAGRRRRHSAEAGAAE